MADMILVYNILKKKMPRIYLVYAAGIVGGIIAALACNQQGIFGCASPLWH